jgi:dTDP-glucose 4,6-dehydratase
MSQCLTGRPVTVFGDGSQTRSFCYVDDMVKGIYKLLMSSQRGPVNVGNPDELSLLEMARLIIRLTKSKSRIVHRPLPIDDPKVRQPDISLARRTLDWKPRVSLRQGLTRTVRYFRRKVASP